MRRVLLFFEILPTAWMRMAGTRILIPNQEWMRPEVIRNVSRCAEVWCKTHYAEDIFRRLGFNTRYIGFSSKDIYLADVEKDYNRFIHVAGRSHLKGTKAIIDLWLKHPEWPSLTLVAGNGEWTRCAARNLVVRHGRVSDTELHALMNRCGIHLCPSQTEGYGHYIAEALATKALAITVNAPPMNELVSPELGLLAKYNKIEAFGFSQKFYVDPIDLEARIEEAIQMRLSEKALLGESARAVFLKRHAEFEQTLLSTLRRLIAQ